MRKNRFCTFTLISALMIAALPSSLAIAGNESGAATVSASVQSLPVQQNATLTIRPSETDGYDPKDSKYTAYRVMSLTQTNGTDWSWNFVNGFTAPAGISFDPDELGNYPASKLQNLAGKLSLQVTSSMTDKLPEKGFDQGSKSLTWTTADFGIYLVCETVTAAGNFPAEPFLAAIPCTDESTDSTWNYNVEARPKGSVVGLEKLIHEAKGSYINTASYDGHLDTVAVDDTVQYLITTRIPSYTDVFFENGKNPTFKLTDTIAKGLTLNENSVGLSLAGTALTKNTDYTQSVVTNDSGTILTINLDPDYLGVKDHQNKDLVLAYTAQVNANASLADEGNENVVTLDYSYDPTDPEKTKEVEDDAKVYTFGIEIEKFDGDSDGASKQKLQGAEFALYKEKTKGGSASEALSQEPYKPVGVTDANGILDFKGLDAGTYYLKEVKAPDGYSLLTNPIKVEIIPEADGYDPASDDPQEITGGGFTVKINDKKVEAGSTEGVSRILSQNMREETVIVSAANHKGFSLPMSGGSGITLFLVIAATGLMVITVYFTRERKEISGTDDSHKA